MPSNCKIVFITSKSRPTSGGSYFLQKRIVESLAKAKLPPDYQAIIVDRLHHETQIAVETNENISYVDFKPNKFRFLLTALAQTFISVREILRLDFSSYVRLVIAQSNSKLLARRIGKFDLALSISPIHDFLGNPYIVNVYDLLYLDKPYFDEVGRISAWNKMDSYFKFMVPRSSKIIVTSSHTRDILTSYFGYPNDRVVIIPLPAPEKVVHNDIQRPQVLSKSLTNVSNFILYPAQFWTHKNHQVLIRAMVDLPQIHLVLVGSDGGALKLTEKLIRELDLMERVHVLGFVSELELATLFANASILCFPSLAPPDNMPALEAMANEVPVICADIPGIREQLGDASYFADPYSSESWTKAITAIMENQIISSNLKANGQELVNLRKIEVYVDSLVNVACGLGIEMSLVNPDNFIFELK